MSLRTMLPSHARVGDTIHFCFPDNRSPKTSISGFEVTINGKAIDNPEIMKSRAGGQGRTGATNLVFMATEPGTYHFEITPLVGNQKQDRRLNSLEVTL
jgi:hypothetical protein